MCTCAAETSPAFCLVHGEPRYARPAPMTPERLEEIRAGRSMRELLVELDRLLLVEAEHGSLGLWVELLLSEVDRLQADVDRFKRLRAEVDEGWAAIDSGGGAEPLEPVQDAALPARVALEPAQPEGTEPLE